MARKSNRAFRTIQEACDELDEPKHVLRYWERNFPELRPVKRGGGRRYYRPDDIELLHGLRVMLRHLGYTLQGVQRVLRDSGKSEVKRLGSEHRLALQARSRPVQPSAPALRATARHAKALSHDLKDTHSMDLQQIVDALRATADELRE